MCEAHNFVTPGLPDAGGNCDHGGLGRHDHSFLSHPAQGYKFLSPGEWLVDVLPGVFRRKPLAETGFSPERYPLWDAKKKKRYTDGICFPLV